MAFNKSFLFTTCFLCLIFIIACKKEKAIHKDYKELIIPTTLNVTKIEVVDSLDLWASVGIHFGEGAFYHSSNGGQNWVSLLQMSQEINDFSKIGANIQIYPFGNKLIHSNDNGQNWNTTNLLGWEFYAAGTQTLNFSYMVAGENFGTGTVVKIDHHTNTIVRLDTLQHQLRDIHCLNDSSCFAVGYGVILKTVDGGQNWIPAQARGDYYQAIVFSSNTTAYVFGDYGSIWKTTDTGTSWKKIRSGSTFFNTKNRLRAAHFINDDTGVVVGKKGLCWLTFNAGESWIPIDNLPKEDFYTVVMTTSSVYIGAVQGKIYHFVY